MVKKIQSYKIENKEGTTVVSLWCADGEKLEASVADVINMSLLFNLKQPIYLVAKGGMKVLKTVSGIATPAVTFKEVE